MSRQFLITKFVCSVCGSTLSLTYDRAKRTDAYDEGEPTGADMVKSLIAIEPCRTCMAPMQTIKNALKILKESA